MLSNQKNPLVSIFIPIYNSAKFLRESLDSIVSPNIQIVFDNKIFILVLSSFRSMVY